MYFYRNESAEENVSLIEDKGIYNPVFKKQVRKDKFGKDNLSFMIQGSEDQKKQVFFGFCFCFHGFMAFLIQSKWLGLEVQDFKEDMSDMGIDYVNFILALLFDNLKNTYYTFEQ